MRMTRIFSTAVLSGILLASALFFITRDLRQGLRLQRNLEVERLESMAGALLDKAHQKRDDLAMQELVQAIGQATQVRQAYVSDLEGKVLAHSRLSQVGRLLELPRTQSNVWHVALRHNGESWGRLVLVLTADGYHTLCSRQVLVGLICCTLLWIAVMVGCLYEETELNRITTLASETRILLNESKIQCDRLVRHFEEAQKVSIKQLQDAVERMEAPSLLLDGRQRVIALNKKASEALGGLQREEVLNHSWQEIPALQAYGRALEASLLSPEKTLSWPSADQAYLDLRTDAQLASTWIAFRSRISKSPIR